MTVTTFFKSLREERDRLIKLAEGKPPGWMHRATTIPEKLAKELRTMRWCPSCAKHFRFAPESCPTCATGTSSSLEQVQRELKSVLDGYEKEMARR